MGTDMAIHDSDPLLRAVATGDTACPDGRALARLGALIRGQTVTPSADLGGQVQARMLSESLATSDDDRDAQLGLLIRNQRPAPVDLRDRVRARLVGSQRLVVQADPVRQQRHRLISAVIVAHLAAALVFAVIRFGHPSEHQLRPSEVAATAPGVARLPTDLPSSWSALRDGGDLFRLRRSPDLRSAARRAWGMERSAGDTAAALRWLIAQQSPDGRIATGQVDADHLLAVHGLATLALLGEGFGDPGRVAATRLACAWLAAQPTPENPTSLGITTLALVEGSLLFADPQLGQAANASLAQLAQAAPAAAPAGLFSLLAVECAYQGGLALPPRLLEQTRRTLARGLPADEERHVSRLGLATLGRVITGHHGVGATRLAEQLADMSPHEDASGLLDPLAWLPASLALRDLGGSTWARWSADLQQTIEPSLTRKDGLAWVAADQVRFANQVGGDVFATAVTVLNLQVAYRYLPVATNH